MALNFPLNPADGSIYIDPISGLKYIFNKSIGGWETAIQPPAIVTTATTPPDITLDGFLWYDSSTQILSILRGGTWIPITGASDGSGNMSVGPTPPDVKSQGDLWWDSVGGILYIYFVDATSAQWVIASPNVGGETNTNIYTGPNAPPDPVIGSAWFNSLDQVLYIYTGGNPPWKPALSPVDGVGQVTGISPIIVTDNTTTPVVSISPATELAQGSVRFATNAEASSAADVNAALTPFKLAQGIDAYLPDATTTTRGVVKLASQQEAVQGTESTKAITPATLSVALAASGNPTGTIIAFAGQTAPEGYFICDGTIIQNLASQTIQGITGDFRNLRTVLGTAYSSNNTDAVLPDLRGEFVRGANAGRIGVDAGREIGSFQEQSVQVHYHQITTGTPSTESNALEGGGNRASDDAIDKTGTSGARGEDVAATFATDTTETRPRNIAILYCIKY